MIPTSSRIVVQGTTPHVHEQKAIAALIEALPDADPFRVWCLFDLVDPSGRRYEIDALVLAPHGLYHVEIKSHPGAVSGDSVDWRFTFPDGGSIVRENPMRLAELKSRVLASELRRKLGQEAPFVETLIYLSDASKVDLAGPASVRVLKREHLRKALQFGELPGVAPSTRPPIDNRRAGKTSTPSSSSGSARALPSRASARTCSISCSTKGLATRTARRTTSGSPR